MDKIKEAISKLDRDTMVKESLDLVSDCVNNSKETQDLITKARNEGYSVDEIKKMLNISATKAVMKRHIENIINGLNNKNDEQKIISVR